MVLYCSKLLCSRGDQDPYGWSDKAHTLLCVEIQQYHIAKATSRQNFGTQVDELHQKLAGKERELGEMKGQLQAVERRAAARVEEAESALQTALAEVCSAG